MTAIASMSSASRPMTKLRRFVAKSPRDQIRAVRAVLRSCLPARTAHGSSPTLVFPVPGKPHFLRPQHVAEDARLFANRQTMIAGLGLAPGGVVAEVGVAKGAFTQILLDTLSPRKFVAIDNFQMHVGQDLRTAHEDFVFDGVTQLDFYRQRFGGRVLIEQGDSAECLTRYPDQYFDVIYIDAGHDYAAVKADAEAAKAKVKPGGVVVFNDYVLLDMRGKPYGVVQAVNELLTTGGWVIIGFALQINMFCDIALRRLPSTP
jgi:predicted O-methyltransferase YrrM